MSRIYGCWKTTCLLMALVSKPKNHPKCPDIKYMCFEKGPNFPRMPTFQSCQAVLAWLSLALRGECCGTQAQGLLCGVAVPTTSSLSPTAHLSCSQLSPNVNKTCNFMYISLRLWLITRVATCCNQVICCNEVVCSCQFLPWMH